MKYLFYLVCLLLLSCSNHEENGSNKSDSKHELSSSTSSEVIVDEEDNSLGFEDGTYEAEVEYYNPNTGTNSYYTLDVEVADNIVTVIHFPNGGWLDDTHIISGGELDEDGTTTLETDKGYIYTITINR